MNKILTILFIVFINLPAMGQNAFFIGEKSYPCTNTITLKANAEDGEDLQVCIAKEGKAGFIAVTTISATSEEFTGKLIINLEDGNVLTCSNMVASKEVDDRSMALYALTDEQLTKLKSSNIHSVEYTMVLIYEVKYSASNSGVNTMDLVTDFFTSNEEPSAPAPPVEEKPAAGKPFMYVEVMPSFPGGAEEMYRFIYEKLEYPSTAKAKGIAGQVILQFEVSKTGEILDAKVVRGIGGGCDEEALRVVNIMPTWNPGMHNGRNVAVTYTLPIKFVL